MLIKPGECGGCALHTLGAGFMAPSLSTHDPLGVALLGEALGQDEADEGQPFVGRAGFKLTRLVEWAGYDRAQFDIYNTVWCRPPNNLLDGQAYEFPAVAHCRSSHWDHLLDRVRVVVPMGNVALAALCGSKGILKARGYVREDGGRLVVPTVHPSYIARGNSNFAACFINDIRKAVTLAETGYPHYELAYCLDPSPAEALRWAEQSLIHARSIAYDIETPFKGEDESDTDDDEDISFVIERIGFSAQGLSGLSIPFEPSYFPAIRLLLESTHNLQGELIERVVWNAGFDNPRLARYGFTIAGPIHDGMVAWHVLHSDLPKSLGFVATFTCPWQPAWKHLSGARPAFYNCTDADVEWRSWDVISGELRRTRLWRVYERDVLEIDPILVRMSTAGMPVDSATRWDRATRLAESQHTVLEAATGRVPLKARRYAPKNGFTRTPKGTDGLVGITVNTTVKRCSICGSLNPLASHFRGPTKSKRGRPAAPCYGGSIVKSQEDVQRFARLEPWKPSRLQLIAYQESLDRPVPMVYDKKLGKAKPTMNERALKDLSKKYPDDPFYAEVIRYRKLDKLAGTYIGRPPR